MHYQVAQPRGAQHSPWTERGDVMTGVGNVGFDWCAQLYACVTHDRVTGTARTSSGAVCDGIGECVCKIARTCCCEVSRWCRGVSQRCRAMSRGCRRDVAPCRERVAPCRGRVAGVSRHVASVSRHVAGVSRHVVSVSRACRAVSRRVTGCRSHVGDRSTCVNTSTCLKGPARLGGHVGLLQL